MGPFYPDCSVCVLNPGGSRDTGTKQDELGGIGMSRDFHKRGRVPICKLIGTIAPRLRPVYKIIVLTRSRLFALYKITFKVFEVIFGPRKNEYITIRFVSYTGHLLLLGY